MSLDNVKNVLLILSGKGGVGKSSITVQLALSLSLAGKSVGILDVDLTGPSIPRLLGLEDAKITQAPGGWLPVQVHPSQNLPPLPSNPPQNGENGSSVPSPAHNGSPTSNGHSSAPSAAIGPLHAISLAFLLPSRSSAVIWRGPKKTAMVRQFLTDVLWPPSGIDYLLIDTPPGTSDEHIALAETLLSCTRNPTPSSALPDSGAPNLAGAVVVTTPQAVAISDVRKELNFCKKTGIPVVGVVENMAGFVCECCGEETNLFGKGGGEVMARDFGIRFLGRVSLDSQWGRLVEEGRRPRYEKVDVEKEEEEEEEEEEDEEGNGVMGGTGQDTNGRGGRLQEREEGLLVDKYRSCKLSESISGIAKDVVQIVEESEA